MRSTAVSAFTLIELLAVIAVVGILTAIIIPVLGNVRGSAHSAQCLSNLRQLGVLALLYADDNDDKLMPADHTFPQKLWPYVYEVPKSGPVPISGNPPAALANTIFECPQIYSESGSTRRSYGVNACFLPDYVEETTSFDGKIVRRSSFQMPSKTVLFGDVKASSKLNPSSLNTRHGDRANVVYMDGHTESLIPTPQIRQSSPIRIAFWLGVDR